MENQEKYNLSYIKFEHYFEQIVHRIAKLQKDLFENIDLEDFKIFFEAPISKGKNKGLPRLYSIFDRFLKSSQTKFSDETYIEDVCFALTCKKIDCSNGLTKTPCEIMVGRYIESAYCGKTFVDYSTLENELYTDDAASYLEVKDTLDILFRRVFKAGYLKKYFNGPDLMMLKNYLKSLKELNDETNIKNFTNNYKDYRNFSAKAYDTRLRNIYKAWFAFSIVKFDLGGKLKGNSSPFESFQECIDFLDKLKPLKERKKYFKELKQKEAKISTPEDKQLRYSTLKEYLVKKFGGLNVREVDGAFEVLVGKKWCLKYFLNGGYNNLKTGEKGSWLKDLNV